MKLPIFYRTVSYGIYQYYSIEMNLSFSFSTLYTVKIKKEKFYARFIPKQTLS